MALVTALSSAYNQTGNHVTLKKFGSVLEQEHNKLGVSEQIIYGGNYDMQIFR